MSSDASPTLFRVMVRINELAKASKAMERELLSDPDGLLTKAEGAAILRLSRYMMTQKGDTIWLEDIIRTHRSETESD